MGIWRWLGSGVLGIVAGYAAYVVVRLPADLLLAGHSGPTKVWVFASLAATAALGGASTGIAPLAAPPALQGRVVVVATTLNGLMAGISMLLTLVNGHPLGTRAGLADAVALFGGAWIAFEGWTWRK